MEGMEMNTTLKQRNHFGPGLMESLTLTTWTDRHRNRWVRLVGTTPIYCGITGFQHDVGIDIRDHLTQVERDLRSLGVQTIDAEGIAVELLARAFYDTDTTCDCEEE